MGRPKHKRFALSGSIDLSDVLNSILTHTRNATTANCWPDRPHVSDRRPDAELEKLRKNFKIPARVAGIDPMALLENELFYAEEAIRNERKRAAVSAKADQIKSIAELELGASVPTAIHDDVFCLLAGMAWRDRRFGRSDWSRLQVCHDQVRCQTVITEELQQWARWLVFLGATPQKRPHKRPHGGGSSLSELVFVSVLINFWIDVLGREPTTRSSERRTPELTRFVHACLIAVGVSARTAPRAQKIKFGQHKKAPPQSPRRLTLDDTHQRILRVKKEMRAAADLGLNRNYLARTLNR